MERWQLLQTKHRAPGQSRQCSNHLATATSPHNSPQHLPLGRSLGTSLYASSVLVSFPGFPAPERENVTPAQLQHLHSGSFHPGNEATSVYIAYCSRSVHYESSESHCPLSQLRIAPKERWDSTAPVNHLPLLHHSGKETRPTLASCLWTPGCSLRVQSGVDVGRSGLSSCARYRGRR